MNLGQVKYDRCPKSFITEDIYRIIELIDWSDETGIPIAGNCLLEQSEYTRTYRRIILSERAVCSREIASIKKSADKTNKRPATGQSTMNAAMPIVGPRRKGRVDNSPRKRRESVT